MSKKIKAPALRIRKDGKPYQKDFERYKAHIKENFDYYRQFQGENLPKAAKSYYNRIEAGKKVAESRLHNPETGRFFSKKAQAAIEKTLENFAKDTGIPLSEVKGKKDIIRDIVRMESQRRQENLMPVDAIIDLSKQSDVKKVFIIDQKGNKKEVTKISAIEKLVSSTKKGVQATEGFNAMARVNLNRITGELEIFIPDLSGLSEEEINELIETLKEDGEFSITKSPPRKKKNQEKAPDYFSMTKNELNQIFEPQKQKGNGRKKAVNKKPDQRRPGKKAN